MTNEKDARVARDAEKRLDAFLDCLARLMAKKWLREQQDEPDREVEPPRTETNDE